MRTTTTTRGAVTGLGAAALLGLCMAGPALADPSPTGADGTSNSSMVGRQGPPTYNSWGNGTMPKQGPPSYNTWPSQHAKPVTAVLPTTTGVHVDFTLVGAALVGALVGVGGAALVVTSTRGRRHAAHA